jgi:hypothetical protein
LFCVPNCRPLPLDDELDDLPLLVVYMFLVATEIMSWLSDSSPVSAEKPRYVTDGSLTDGTEKQGVHSSSFLNASSSVSDLSW